MVVPVTGLGEAAAGVATVGGWPTVTCAVPLNDPLVAVTVAAVPAEVNNPPDVIEPVVADQVNVGWLARAAPNWSRAVAVNCCVPPKPRPAVAGVTVVARRGLIDGYVDAARGNPTAGVGDRGRQDVGAGLAEGGRAVLRGIRAVGRENRRSRAGRQRRRRPGVGERRLRHRYPRRAPKDSCLCPLTGFGVAAAGVATVGGVAILNGAEVTVSEPLPVVSEAISV